MIGDAVRFTGEEFIKMNILLVGNYGFDVQQSMGHFALMLRDGLTKAGHHVKLICPQPFFGRLKPSGHGIGKWLGYIDKFLIFPCMLRRELPWADVVHICDHSNALYVKHVKKVPHIITCHDMIAIRDARGEFPGHVMRWTGKILQRMIFGAMRSAGMVACVSQTTRMDVLRLSGLGQEKVRVIHNGLNYPYSHMDGEEARGRLAALGIDTGRPYILHVGGNQWYKNRAGVIEIFKYLVHSGGSEDIRLVMVGQPFTEEMSRRISEYGMEGKVQGVISPGNEDLRALYSGAAALVFPSLQEGFGWPIIEAQACGCVVFATNRAPMTEVGGDSAVYITPEDPAGAAGVLREYLGDPARLDDMRKRGYENIRNFSAEKMIAGYCDIYREIRA